MKTKILKSVIVIFVLMGVCMACKQSDNSENYFGNYDEVGRVYFVEEYAYDSSSDLSNKISIKATFTKELISYEISPVFINHTEPVVYERGFDELGWEALIEIMEKYQLADWTIEGRYLYRNYSGGPSHYVKQEDVEYVRQGDFFNLNPEGFYLGMDQNEQDFRCSYYGVISVFPEDDQARPFWPESGPNLLYSGYGVPPNYNEFRQELWDFVIEYTGGFDWRVKSDQVGQELMHQMFPYMTEQKSEENPYQNIRYFSIMESYGGKEIGPKAGFTYDGGEKTFFYRYPNFGKLYSIAENKQPFLYCDDAGTNISTPNYFVIETIIDENEVGLETLKSLLEKYAVFEWEPNRIGEFYSAYVNQGTFFNVDNLTDIEDENEKWFRSSCDILINIILSDGTYKEIRLQNGKLPQTYNQFRVEFWDYFVDYCYRNEVESLYVKYEQSGLDDPAMQQTDSYAVLMIREMIYKNIELEEFLEQKDWRTYLDEQGYQFMLLKYPYMDSETENSE